MQKCGDPGARGNVRGGEARPSNGESFAQRPRPVPVTVAKVIAARAARFHRLASRARKRAGGSAQAEGRGVTWVRRHRASGGEKEAAGLSQFTGEDRLLEGCARASVSCCRSRQASPGPEKREHGPLLTERPIHVDGV